MSRADSVPIAAADSGARVREVPAGPVPSGRKARILVMDDEEHIRFITRSMLEFCNHEVVTVREGAAAIECYRSAAAEGRPFDAVILDLRVPNGLGGMDTLRSLRQIDSRVRAIVCSGTLTEPVAFYREQGFCAELAKPFRLQDIHRTLASVLEPVGTAAHVGTTAT